MAKNETYEEFVKKFEIKKTTDDCYTPPLIYEAIKNWVIKKYNLENKKIVRPFYLGGDYQNFKYDTDTVVIDNPPFSILSEITKFYEKNNIKFFLFAPHLTVFSLIKQDLTVILTYTEVVYENKAKINTSFITNLDSEYKIFTSLELKNILESFNIPKKKRGVYNRPLNVFTSCDIVKIFKGNKDFQIRKSDILGFTQNLVDENGKKVKTFGTAVILTEEKAKQMENIKKESYNKKGIDLFLP